VQSSDLDIDIDIGKTDNRRQDSGHLAEVTPSINLAFSGSGLPIQLEIY